MMVVDTVECASTHYKEIVLAARSINHFPIVLHSNPSSMCAVTPDTIPELHQ